MVSQTVTAEHGPPLPQTVVLAKQQLDYFGQDDPSRLRHWLGTAYYDFAYEFDRRHRLSLASVDGTASAWSPTRSRPPASWRARSWRARRRPAASWFKPRIKWRVRVRVAGRPSREPCRRRATARGAKLRSYTYDTVGSMVTRSSGGGTWRSSSTTARDQLGGPPHRLRAGVEEYLYDHAGQRAAVVTRDAGGAVESVRVFFGDAGSCCR
ncbi:MAG: hypothetical protein HS111_11285 [Kofleriaceae bacterium]|nr:hypothetical protein [Kofleriaceae bacterium]